MLQLALKLHAVLAKSNIFVQAGGAVACAVYSGASGPGSSPGWGQCVVFLGKTLYLQVNKWVPANCWANLTKLQGSDLRWTSIPSRGSRNTSNLFMLQKLGYAPAGSYELALAPRLHSIFSSVTFLLHERMEEMPKLVVKYLKDRYSARWKELTSKTAEHHMISENI